MGSGNREGRLAKVHRLAVLGVVGSIGLIVAAQAQAVEYRLRIVNMWDSASNAIVKAGELADGASGPGLEELVASLDRGDLPTGPLPTDRTFRWASETVARGYGAVRVLAEISPAERARPAGTRFVGRASQASGAFGSSRRVAARGRSSFTTSSCKRRAQPATLSRMRPRMGTGS
jgi:hypothetical protein